MTRFSIEVPAKVLAALLGLAVVSPPAQAKGQGGAHRRSAVLSHRARQHLSTDSKRGVPARAARPVLPAKRGSRHP